MSATLLESIHADVRSLCSAAIKKSFAEFGIPKKTLDSITLEQPPDETLGDLAFPCFTLAKELKKSPVEIAKIVADGIKKLPSEISVVHATGPYVNFFLNPATLGPLLLNTTRTPHKKTPDKIIIEYVSPNTNKPLHLGHVRNAVLGDSVARLNEFLGTKVIRTSLVNDRGIHICKSMVAYEEERLKVESRKSKVPTPQNTGKKGDHFVGDYYVLYNTLLQKDPSIEDRAKECLQKWEAGDKKTHALWKKMNSWVFKGMNETYRRLGIFFDKTYLESEMYTQGKDIIMKGLAAGVFKRDKTGAVYADLEAFNLPNKILLRKDGSTIYITQDVYLAFKKFKDFKPNISSSAYVVGSEQDLYLRQLFAVLKQLKVSYADHLVHLSYGMVRLPEGKMKSREGTTADADTLLDGLEQLVKKEILKREKNLTRTEVNKRTRIIALSALKYYLLMVGPKSDLIFNPKESIALHGKTGPYLLYTYARLKSIARRAGGQKVESRKSKVEGYDFHNEKALIVALLTFDERIEKAAEWNPSIHANYLYDLAQKANDYYHTTPILKAEQGARTARLLLVAKIADTLKVGLALLGISTIERM